MRKKLILILACLMVITFLFCGCGLVQLEQTDQQEIIAKIAGRRVGYALAQRYPDIARKLEPLAEIALAKENAIGTFVSVLSKLQGYDIDPMLKADIADLLALFKVKDVNLSIEQKGIMQAAIRGFLTGIKMVKGVTV